MIATAEVSAPKHKRSKTLYLVRGLGDYKNTLYVVTSPKPRMTYDRGTILGDGWFSTYTYDHGGYPRHSLTDMCVTGAKRAGVKNIPEPGQVVRLSLFLRPVKGHKSSK